MYLAKLTYPILTIYGSPKIHTDLLWDLTFLFVILGGVYFLFIFFFRNKLSKTSKKNRLKRQELAPTISNFLFHSPEDPKNEQKEYVELKIVIRDYLNDKKFRKVISQILLDLQKDLAGGTKERLCRLYKELELHHDAFQKLESWRWETISQGILELSRMEVQESYQLIKKFTNDRRGVVRKQAELAIVELDREGINYLLDTTTTSISEWQQLKLIETLGKIKNYRPPQFKAWLLSQNKDVVLFALRLIKHYNQKGAESSINELVKHKNDEVRLAAIQCIIDFNFENALPILKSVFLQGTNLTKIAIIKAISVLGNEVDTCFLREIAATDNSSIIVGKAQSAINMITPDAILPSKDIVKIIEENGSTKEKNEELQNISVAVDRIKEGYEVIENAIPKTVEVEDIEFYDEVEIPEKKEKHKRNPYVPAFELNPIEEGYGKTMDDLLGSIVSDEENANANELQEDYNQIPFEKKSMLLDDMEESGDEREIPLLEHITEQETDADLRFRAFKILQSIKKRVGEEKVEIDIVDEQQLPLAQESIFYPLYQYAADLDSKLILIKEIEAVGDSKEIPFLENLILESEGIVKKAATQALDTIIDKPLEYVASVDSSLNDEEINRVVQEFEKENVNKDTRIPMELFLLYEEMGIESSEKVKEEPPLFDFELSPDFFNNNDSLEN